MKLPRRLAAFVMDRKSLGAELAEALDANVELRKAARNLSYIATIRGREIQALHDYGVKLEDENRRLRENLVEMERLYTASCDDVRFLLTGEPPMRGAEQ